LKFDQSIPSLDKIKVLCIVPYLSREINYFFTTILCACSIFSW